MFMRRSLVVHAIFTSRRLSFLYPPPNRMVTWNPSVRPISWEVLSYIGIWVKYRCYPGTASGRSEGYNICLFLESSSGVFKIREFHWRVYLDGELLIGAVLHQLFLTFLNNK